MTTKLRSVEEVVTTIFEPEILALRNYNLTVEESVTKLLIQDRQSIAAVLIEGLEEEKLPKTNAHSSRTFFVGAAAQIRMDAYNQGIETAIALVKATLDVTSEEK